MDDGRNDSLAAAELMKTILKDDERGAVMEEIHKDMPVMGAGHFLRDYFELYRRCFRVVNEERTKAR